MKNLFLIYRFWGICIWGKSDTLWPSVLLFIQLQRSIYIFSCFWLSGTLLLYFVATESFEGWGRGPIILWLGWSWSPLPFHGYRHSPVAFATGMNSGMGTDLRQASASPPWVPSALVTRNLTGIYLAGWVWASHCWWPFYATGKQTHVWEMEDRPW